MQNSSKKVVVRNKRRINVKVVRPPKMEKAAPKDSAEKVPFKLSESEKKIIQAYRMAGRNDKAAVQNTLVHYFLPPVTKANDEKPAQLDNFEDIESEPELSNSRGTLRKIFTGIGICFIALFATFLFYELFFVPTDAETSPPVKVSSSEMSDQLSQQNVAYEDSPKNETSTENKGKPKSNDATLEDICNEVNEIFSDNDNSNVTCFTDNKALYAHIMVNGLHSAVTFYQESFQDSTSDLNLWPQAKSAAATVYQTISAVAGRMMGSDVDIDIFLDILDDDNTDLSLYSIENGFITYDAFTDDDIAKLSISDTNGNSIKRSTENLSELSYSVRSDWYFDNRPIDTSPSGVKGLGSIQTNYYQISSDEPSHIRATAAKSYFYSGDSVDKVVNRLIDVWESEDNGISSATYEISAKESLTIDNNVAIKVVYQNDYYFGGNYEHISYFLLIDDTLYTFDLTLVPDIEYSVKREYETEFAAIIDSIQCPI